MLTMIKRQEQSIRLFLASFLFAVLFTIFALYKRLTLSEYTMLNYTKLSLLLSSVCLMGTSLSAKEKGKLLISYL